jgi:hypothetical protein
VERALPSAEIKQRLSALAIGLASDCDAPEGSVEEIMRAKLPGATGLPFVAFLTPDGVWVDGYSGYKDAPALLEVINTVEKSPLLDATPAVARRLEKVAKAATDAAEKGNWKAVLAAAREAGKSTGRCPERTAIKAAERQAREWAAEQFETAVQTARSGGDLAPVRKSIADVRRHFADEPEGEEAETGRKAVLRLTQIRDAEGRPNPKRDLRETAAETFAGSRWATIFDRPPAAGKDEK